MQCATVFASNTLHQVVFVADMTNDPPNCDYFVFEAADYTAFATLSSASPASSPFTADEITALKLQAANPSPFNLSPTDGGLISGAVALVWITGWALKKLVQALNTDGEKE